MTDRSRLGLVRGAICVLRKEVLEARRDRNLVLQLLIVPLLLYPTLAFVGIQLALMNRGAAERSPAVVWTDADTPAPVREALATEAALRTIDAPADWSSGFPRVEDFRARRSAAAGSLRVEVLLAWRPEGDADSAVVYYDASRDRSKSARGRVQAALQDHADSLRLARAARVGLEGEDLYPWRVVTRDLATAAERGGQALALILPILLILMLPQGLFHAALDSLVGERERGTLETLLTSPLGRVEILLGKLGYVVLAGITTFVLNFAGLMLLVFFGLAILLPDAPLEIRLAPGPIAVALLAVLLLSVALAALMMMLAGAARNHREGQAALTPVYLVVAFSGFFSPMTQDTFTLQQAWVPVANVTGLLRAALRDELPLEPTLITFVVLTVSALACMSMASRLVRNEAVLFAPEFSLRRFFLGRGGATGKGRDGAVR